MLVFNTLNEFYLLDGYKKLSFPITMKPFEYTKAEIRNLAQKENALIFDFNVRGNTVDMIYQSNDTLYYCESTLKGGRITLVKKTVISSTYKSSDFGQILLDKSKYYMFVKSEGCFKEFSY